MRSQALRQLIKTEVSKQSITPATLTEHIMQVLWDETRGLLVSQVPTVVKDLTSGLHLGSIRNYSIVSSLINQ